MCAWASFFPGQGSQALGMLAEMAETYQAIEQTFEQASDVLSMDLWRLVQSGPAEQLNRTEITQPAMLTADIALWRVLCSQTSARPAWLLGHSLGEFSALCAAGVMDFESAVATVALRGRSMQAAVAEGVGAMAAVIGASDADVSALCEAAAEGELVVPANYNAPAQVVIAGHVAAVERAVGMAKSYGAKLAKTIPVSVPAHCELMAPAQDALRAQLAQLTLHPASTPVVHNVTAEPSSDDAIPALLVSQLVSPVQWVASVNYVHEQGVRMAVECGPGKVLQGLNKRIAPDMPVSLLASPADFDAAIMAIEGEQNG